MYNGKTRFNSRRRVIVNRRTGIAGVVNDGADELSEVAVTSRYVPVAPPYEPPDEYPMAEVVVAGLAIPWWAWGIAGALAAVTLVSVSKR